MTVTRHAEHSDSSAGSASSPDDSEAQLTTVPRVLVVDDNRDTIMTLGILLRSEGYIVDLANSGAEALAIAQNRPPQIALIDLQMPGRSGFDVANELQRRHGKASATLIAVTAQTGEEYRKRAERSGFSRFVAKPYDPHELLRLLDSLTSPPG